MIALAKARIKIGLILNSYGEENNLKVTDDDIKSEIQKQVKSMPGQEKMVVDYYCCSVRMCLYAASFQQSHQTLKLWVLYSIPPNSPNLSKCFFCSCAQYAGNQHQSKLFAILAQQNFQLFSLKHPFVYFCRQLC